MTIRPTMSIRPRATGSGYARTETSLGTLAGKPVLTTPEAAFIAAIASRNPGDRGGGRHSASPATHVGRGSR
jgi:hypothetical protein